MNKEECFEAFMNLAHSQGTMNCGKKCLCDECEEQCDVRKQYEKDCLLIENLICKYFEPKPYKFEDLKVGMWVWDDKLKIPYKIKRMLHCKWFKAGYKSFVIDLYTDERKYHTGMMEFEENRFYPVTKAMQHQDEVNNNE